MHEPNIRYPGRLRKVTAAGVEYPTPKADRSYLPLPACGERIEVRGSRNPLFEDELTHRLMIVDRVRLLRKKTTEHERILWRQLGNWNFAGYKFHRQHPFDCYVLDFYCPSAKLPIELDGGGHNYRLGQTRDQTHSAFLACHGIGVLQFWNHQVRQELDSVFADDLVCARATTEKESLTFILSLCERERRDLATTLTQSTFC